MANALSAVEEEFPPALTLPARDGGPPSAHRPAGVAPQRITPTSSPPGRPRTPLPAYVPYPATSFPLRDLLLLEQTTLGPEDVACEIGVGSGGTTARLARLCREVVGVEISNAAVARLAPLSRRQPNVTLVAADVTAPDALVGLAGRFTQVVSCDTLEHVADPAAFFAAIARLLAPGGRFFVTFPNEPAGRMHGITRFDNEAALRKVASRAGLTELRAGAARLRPQAAWFAERFGWRPLRALRRASRALQARPRGDGGSQPLPQQFHETSFFRHGALWQRLAPAVNFYWCGVLRLMRASGPAFAVDWGFSRERFGDAQVVLVGRKPLEAVSERA